jgi:hypothetical protein
MIEVLLSNLPHHQHGHGSGSQQSERRGQTVAEFLAEKVRLSGKTEEEETAAELGN